MYLGQWIRNDGTWIHIYNDGSGSFKTSNGKVTGGSTTWTDSTISIGLFGISNTMIIDAPPHEEDGKMVMKLDGYIFQKNTGTILTND